MEINFISSVTKKGAGGGTILWKSLIPELLGKTSVSIHYSYDSSTLWSDFLKNEVKHFIHKEWNTYENRNWRRYDLSFLKFNFDFIEEGSYVILDSIEAVRQLVPGLKKRKCKIFWHYQSPYRFPRFNLLVKYLDINRVNNLNGVIAVSNFLKQTFPFKKDITVVYNAVNQANHPKFIESKDKNLVAFFGRYESYKNPLFLERIDSEHVYIGSSEYASVKVDVPKEKDIGWRTPEQAAELADIFIFPSVNEGFGLSLVEMMAYGKICIAFNSGAFPEIITNEENGFIIEPFDKDSLNKIVDKIINDDKLREKIRTNAINTASNFNTKTFSNNFYNSIIKIGS